MTCLVLFASNKHLNEIRDTDDEVESEETENEQESDGSSARSHTALLRPKQPMPQSHEKCLYLTDCLLSNFIFSPIVIFYWYCSWTFLDVYFLSEQKHLSNFLSLSIGLVVLFFGYLLQEKFQHVYTKLKEFNKCGAILRFLMRNLHAYVITMAIILQWRAIWNIYLFYLVDDLSSQLSIAIASLCYFCLTRSTRTLVSNPFMIFFDDTEEFFVSRSRHKIDLIESSYIQYTIDFLMIEIIECFIMNFIWFGVQNYLDSVIYPNDQQMDLIVSFFSSHLLCFALLLVQRVIFRHVSQYSLIPRLIVEDTVNTLMIISVVLYWKFYWDLGDYFVLESPYKLEFFLAGHFVAFLLSVITKSTGILVGPGIDYLDGEINETKAFFEITYSSEIYQTYFTRMENRNSTREASDIDQLIINPSV